MKVGFDQFYTKDHIAKECYDTLLNFLKTKMKNENFLFLEPSVGKGAFYNLLPINNRIGIDIDPKVQDKDVFKLNFFDFELNSSEIGNRDLIVIGNPPFGKQCNLAIKFFNKCDYLNAKIIAFIIPRTFKRTSVQNSISLNYNLKMNKDLPTKNCFEPTLSVKCCFQIWERNIIPRTKIPLITTSPDFEFVKYGKLDEFNQPTPPEPILFDFAMKAFGSNCGQLELNKEYSFRPKSWHFIKSKIDIDLLISRFKHLDYSISKDSCRQDSLGKSDLISLYAFNFKKGTPKPN